MHQIKQEEWLAATIRERRMDKMVGKCNQGKWIQAGLKIGEHLKEIEKLSEQLELGYIGIGISGNQFAKNTASALHIDTEGVKREVLLINGKIRLYEEDREFYVQA